MTQSPPRYQSDHIAIDNLQYHRKEETSQGKRDNLEDEVEDRHDAQDRKQRANEGGITSEELGVLTEWVPDHTRYHILFHQPKAVW